MARFLLGTLLACVLLGAPAHAREQVTVVLDASGSMWREMDGATRFDLARRALDTIAEGLPAGVEMGLAVFGHRLRGDCFDVEVFPPSADPESLAEMADRIVPKGQTCLARAIRSVAGRADSIVILGDGGDGCHEDACALAAAAMERGGVRIHVLGFGPDAPAVSELECIAGRGAGVSGFVRSRSGAKREAKRMLGVLAGRRAPPPATESSPAVGGDVGASGTAAGTGEVILDRDPWVRPPAAWGLADPESGIVRARTTSERIEAKAGRYQVFWKQAESGSSRVYLPRLVDVVPDRVRRGSPSTGVRFRVPDGIGPPYFWRLLDLVGEQAARVAGSLAPQPVPSGTYELRWKGSQHAHPELSFGEVHIERGRLNTVSLDGGMNVLLPDWLASPYEFVLRGSGGDRHRFRASGRSLFLPGRYRLYWKQTRHHHRPVEWGRIEVPETGFVRIEVDSGVRFTSEAERPPAGITAIPQRGGAESALAQSLGPMPLPPGSYRFRVQDETDGPSRVLESTFDVREGELLEVALPERSEESP